MANRPRRKLLKLQSEKTWYQETNRKQPIEAVVESKGNWKIKCKRAWNWTTITGPPANILWFISITSRLYYFKVDEAKETLESESKRGRCWERGLIPNCWLKQNCTNCRGLCGPFWRLYPDVCTLIKNRMTFKNRMIIFPLVLDP